MNAEIASKGIFALGLAAVAAVTVSSYTRKSVEPEIVTPAKAAALTPPPESPAQFRARAIDNIKLRTTSQRIEGFGNVLVISFSIKNANPFPVKDVVVYCDVGAASGTSLSSNRRTVYETIPTNSFIMVKDFNMGFIDTQSKNAGCIALDATI